RPGTESLPGIVGMHAAIEKIEQEKYQNFNRYKKYRDLFYEKLKQAGLNFSVNGNITELAPTILNLSFANTIVESLLMTSDLEALVVPSGSACTGGSIQSAQVLTAMYVDDDPRTDNSGRFSFGVANVEWQMINAAERATRVF